MTLISYFLGSHRVHCFVRFSGIIYIFGNQLPRTVLHEPPLRILHHACTYADVYHKTLPVVMSLDGHYLTQSRIVKRAMKFEKNTIRTYTLVVKYTLTVTDACRRSLATYTHVAGVIT